MNCGNGGFDGHQLPYRWGMPRRAKLSGTFGQEASQLRSVHVDFSIILWYYYGMGKHAKTLQAIFATPTRSNILWSDVESLLKAYGAQLTAGKGSRVRIALRGVRAVFHRPHPRKEADRGTVESMRRFLSEAGVRP